MKKLIIIFAIIALFAIAFNAFSDALSGPSSDSDVTSEKESGSVDSNVSSSDTSGPTTEESYAYSYVVNIYKQGTTTKLGDIKLESNNNTATLSISGNQINLDAKDKIAGIQFTDMQSVDSLSVTTVSPGTSTVYITYTEKTSSSTHTHSYTVTKAATCTTAGTSTCSCGATQTIAATGHSWSTPADCTTNPICTVCFYEGDVIAGPHIGDKNGDGNCDGCGTKI